MPLPIQVGSVTQALQRAFGFKGRYVPMLDEVIVPVYVVSDPVPAAVSRLAAATGAQASGSVQGAFVHVFLYNPPNSGVLGVVNSSLIQLVADDGTTLSKPFSAQIKVGFGDPTGTPGPGMFRDTRFGDVPPTLQIRTLRDLVDTLAPFLAEISFPAGPGGGLPILVRGESSDPRQPLVVLQPDTFLEITHEPFIESLTAEPTVRANFQWLEVPISEVGPLGGLPGS